MGTEPKPSMIMHENLRSAFDATVAEVEECPLTVARSMAQEAEIFRGEIYEEAQLHLEANDLPARATLNKIRLHVEGAGLKLTNPIFKRCVGLDVQTPKAFLDLAQLLDTESGGTCEKARDMKSSLEKSQQRGEGLSGLRIVFGQEIGLHALVMRKVAALFLRSRDALAFIKSVGNSTGRTSIISIRQKHDAKAS